MAAPSLMRQLKTRLGTARFLLAEMLGDSELEKHRANSKAQALSVIELLRSPGWQHVPADQRADVTQIATGIAWCPDDLKAITDILTPTTSSPEKNRKMGQNYASSLDMFTGFDWDTLASRNKSMTAKKALIMLRLNSLNGVALNEHSVKMLTSLWMLVSDEKSLGFPQDTKKQFFQVLKKEFESLARKWDHSRTWIQTLPHSALELKALYPDVFRQAFPKFETHPKGKPVPCQLDSEMFLQMEASYRCRGFASEPAASASTGRGGNQLLELAHGVLDQCVQRQQASEPLIRILGGQRQPRSVTRLALTDGDSQHSQSLLAIADGREGDSQPVGRNAVTWPGGGGNVMESVAQTQALPDAPQALEDSALQLEGAGVQQVPETTQAESTAPAAEPPVTTGATPVGPPQGAGEESTAAAALQQVMIAVEGDKRVKRKEQAAAKATANAAAAAAAVAVECAVPKAKAQAKAVALESAVPKAKA